ncbi:MAG: MFS transporter [Pseudomonadales bacterium]|jgi:predicted MFS family arabinose efflux permease|nr:MFS transporter [Pseudomonadales bacterium]
MSDGSASSGAPGAEADAGAEFGPVYRWYALGLLFVVYIFNFIDRQILAILQQSIKEELGLSDTQLGLMGGFAFALFYTFLGIPIARLADRGVRRDILAVCLTIWSVMTAVCGLATSFLQLLAARIGVAVGEAGGSPPAHSMISDIFPAHQRATALGIYALGIPVGTMFGNLLGGWIEEAFDWRTAFMAVGIPGVALALVVRLTLREPRRGASDVPTAPEIPARAPAIETPPPPVLRVFAMLWSRRSFRWMSLGAALHAFVGYGVGYFIPPFFIRSHDFSRGEIGEALFWLGIPGMLGTFLGGLIGDRLARYDVRWYLWLPGLATLVSVPFAFWVYTNDDPWLALWVYAIPVFLGSYYLGPTFSMTQSLVGLRMRALAASILLFVLNLIGLGLGPVFVGVVSDQLAPTYGDESLRIALVAVLAFNVASTGFYLLGARSLKDDLGRRHELT